METSTEVAIVGMSCRFPGASDPEAFWSNIVSGRESSTAFTDDELRAAGVSEAALRDPSYVRSGFVVANADKFDAEFFGFTPREAELLDPQQRLFLECAFHTLEHAGHPPERFRGRIGVYAGVFTSAYLLNLYSQPGLVDAVGEVAVRHANEKDYLATRLSYKLNLTGPSVAVQTSCSTALVAVHMAVQALLAGECDMALSGGASVTHPGTGYAYTPGGLTSPDGHCRPFDASAQGTVFGNGVGVVLLKRLDDALRDGNTIYAVIKGSAINNDGSDKVGFTAPSVNGQAVVIAEAMGVADVSPDTIGLVEAHGTGTPLGDPIEVEALTRAWRRDTTRTGYCAIGSVKSNVGHLGAAAGVAGLIKAALALHHKTLAPTLHFTTPNPNIDFARSPFYVNTQAAPWPASTHPRRAAVSSFGMGGTNAHVVLEEAPARAPEPVVSGDELLCLSARSEPALLEAAAALAAHLHAHPELALRDVAHTLREGRRSFPWRAAFQASSAAQAGEVLASGSAQKLGIQQAFAAPELAFLFPGQGSQYAGACRGLYASHPTFRTEYDACCAVLVAAGAPDLRALMAAGTPVGSINGLQLNDTAIAQPALFTMAYALSQLLGSLGVVPSAMVGHSVGEFVAATLAGVLTRDDALRLVALRGRLMQGATPGKMLSVTLSEQKLLPYLLDHPELDLAAINGPEHCVVAGPSGPLAALNGDLMRAGVVTRNVVTSHAFHSSMMEPVRDAFVAAVTQVPLRAPSRPYLSNLSGDWIRPDEATDPRYWGELLRQPVRFHQSLQRLLESPQRVLVEVGPNTVLTALARQQPALAGTRRAVPTSRHAKDGSPDEAVFAQALAQLWSCGVPLASDPRPGSLIALPTYPFERKRYWIERHRGEAPLPVRPAPAEPLTAPAAGVRYAWQPRALPASREASAGRADWLLLGNVAGRVARAFADAVRTRGDALTVVHGSLSDADTRSATQVVFFADEGTRACFAEDCARTLAADASARALPVTVITERRAQRDAPFAPPAGCAVASATDSLDAAIAGFTERHPRFRWQQLDVALPEVEGAHTARFAASWVEELLAGPGAQPIAWRGRERYVLGCEPALTTGSAARPPARVAVASTTLAGTLGLAASLQGEDVTSLTLVTPEHRSWDGLVAGLDAGAGDALAGLLRSPIALGLQPAQPSAPDGAPGNSPSTHAEAPPSRPRHDLLLVHAGDATAATELLAALAAGGLVAEADAVACLVDGLTPAVPPTRAARRLLEAAHALEASALVRVRVLGCAGDYAGSPWRAALGLRDGHLFLGAHVEEPRTPREKATAAGAAQPASTAAAPAAPAPTAPVQRPAGDVDGEVVAMWQTLFGVPTIGLDDDFFAVGGTSLVAIQLISLVRERFGVELSIETLFDDPTVRGIATQIKGLLRGGTGSDAPGAPGPHGERSPVRPPSGPFTRDASAE